MKKLYSLATLLFLALLGMAASARTFTFVVNDPSLVKMTVYYGGTTVDFNGQNSVTLDGFEISYYDFKMQAVDGYAITNVVGQPQSGDEFYPLSQPTDTWQAFSSSYSDGTTFTVTIEKLEAKTFTLKVDDYTHLANVGSIQSFDSNDIEVSYTVMDSYINVTGAMAETGKYLIKSVKYADGETVEPGTNSFSLDTSKINEGDEVELTTELKELPHYTFEVTDITHLKDLNRQDISYYKPVGNKFTLVTEDSYFSITPADGYQISSIKCGDDDLYLYSSFPLKSNASVYLRTNSGTELASGSTITVVTEEITYPKWTFNGAKGVKFEYNGKEEVSTTDVYEYQLKGESGYLTISCAEEGKRIKSLQKVGSSSPEYVSDGKVQIYIYNPTAAEYNIETVEYFTGKFTVTADEPSKVKVSIGRNQYTLKNEGENEFDFESDNATVTIQHADYGEKVYKVEVNGNALTRNNDYYNTFSFDAADGDKVNVTVAFPDVKVPVSFSCDDEDVTKIISKVGFSYNDEIENWADDDFEVALGKTLNITFNKDLYENITLTANGVDVEIDYSGAAKYTVDSEEDIAFVITADKIPVKVMTINCDQWEHLTVYRTYNYYGYPPYSNPVELTGASTQIELPQSTYNIYLQAKDDYYIAEAPDMTSPVVTYTVSVEDGKTVDVTLEKLVRDLPLVIYTADEDAAKKNTISLSNTKFSGSFDVSYNYNNVNNPIPVGYSTIYVNEDDALSFYPYGIVYLNGELQSEYINLTTIPENTVIKIFNEEPQEWTMNYTFGDGVDVEVYHDLITKIDSPANHTVFHGTHVAIKPVETVSAKAKAPATDFEVKVNGEVLTPNQDGYYEFTADKDVEVAVTKVITTGLDAILVDGQDADIYNLQGIKVGNTATTKTLTPGIYIINGVKIRF